MRDVPVVSKMQLPVFSACAAAPPSMTTLHPVDVQLPIGCGGVPVFPGDVIFGDGEGVVVIPKHLAAEVAADAAEQEQLEAFVLEEVQKGAPVIGTYPPSPAVKAKYDVWRAKRAK
jgi:regulator of RNase E activity RraA